MWNLGYIKQDDDIDDLSSDLLADLNNEKHLLFHFYFIQKFTMQMNTL